MKLISYLLNGEKRIAFAVGIQYYDCQCAHKLLPCTMKDFLKDWENSQWLAQLVYEKLEELEDGHNHPVTPHIIKHIPLQPDKIILLAPVPTPNSCRDGYAFRQHVAAARRNRNVPMIDAFDEYPVFYFTNHDSIQGPGPVMCMPDHFDKLDFELEVAIVICKEGRNIPAENADSYIGGLMIMNDMSARTLQMEEMLLNLGPAKGKDFSTVIGPMLVTTDELEANEVPCKEGHTGKAWDLEMQCRVNGVTVSAGNLSDMDWTFAEIIERCSYGATLYPGDIIGSGTVGTGCFMELNGTARLNNPDATEQWLKPGDKVEMEVTGLGKLKNTIVREISDYSILSKKKKNVHRY